ncbi:MAG: ATP-binding protein [Candidatus Saccharimonas sp.]
MAVEYLILVPCVLVSLLVGALVVMRTLREARYQVYALLTLVFVAISVANTLSLDPESPQLFYVRAVMATTSLGLYGVYLLIRTVGAARQSWSELLSSTKWLGLFTLLVVALDWTPLVFSDVTSGKPPIPIPGVGAALYMLHYVVLCGAGLMTIYRGLADSGRSQSVRNQYRWILIGLLPIVLLAPVTGFVLLLMFHTGDFVILTPVYTLFFVCCVGYAMARHGLYDIRLAAVRTLVYAMSVFVMAMVYFGIAYAASATVFRESVTTGIGMSPLNIVIALLLAFIFQPVKQFFDRVTNKIFYRDRYETSEFIARLGRLLTDTNHLHEVLERAGDEISSTLKASGYMFLIYREQHADVVVGSHLRNHLSDEERASLRVLADLAGEDVFVVGAMPRHHDQQVRHIRSILAKRRVALALPLVTATETVGYLLLGEQLSSGYATRDVKVLRAIADELVIAIQNARSVQEVRDFNEHLEQRVDAATRELRSSNKRLLEMDTTKDEFVSMASHQLRTPLTSVKGYISMVLDGDVGQISASQRQLLEEAFTSSERMVHLIGDFLNVSRLQTGKFIIDPHASDLAKVTRQEVDGMQQIAQSHGLTIIYKQPARFPTLYIDEGKIRQVIMNFMDNAIYYSPETASITVSLVLEDGDAVLRVIDKGMGVPKEVQKKLFSKFFRAENARTQRPDGTGIGLYLAKKVIDGHGGRLVFESTLGKGSTFGFRLPVKKLSTPPKPAADSAV